MDSPRIASRTQAPRYHLPELLHDIHLLDLLELCGTTVQTSSQLMRRSPGPFPAPAWPRLSASSYRTAGASP
jgi:hypothetical protein